MTSKEMMVLGKDDYLSNYSKSLNNKETLLSPTSSPSVTYDDSLYPPKFMNSKNRINSKEDNALRSYFDNFLSAQRKSVCRDEEQQKGSTFRTNLDSDSNSEIDFEAFDLEQSVNSIFNWPSKSNLTLSNQNSNCSHNCGHSRNNSNSSVTQLGSENGSDCGGNLQLQLQLKRSQERLDKMKIKLAKKEKELRLLKGGKSYLKRLDVDQLKDLDLQLVQSRLNVQTCIAEKCSKCKLCSKGENNIALNPCGHVFCQKCTKKIKYCPTCKEVVECKIQLNF